jgi:hypothetical protein
LIGDDARDLVEGGRPRRADERADDDVPLLQPIEVVDVGDDAGRAFHRPVRGGEAFDVRAVSGIVPSSEPAVDLLLGDPVQHLQHGVLYRLRWLPYRRDWVPLLGGVQNVVPSAGGLFPAGRHVSGRTEGPRVEELLEHLVNLVTSEHENFFTVI